MPQNWYGIMLSVDEPRGHALADVIEFARRHLPLADIATGPRSELGAGEGWDAHDSLNCVVQELAAHPQTGEDLVVAALLVVVVFYKVRSFRTLAGFFTDSIGRTSIVVVIVIGASLLSAVIIRSGAPQELARKVVESGFEAWQFLLVLNVILLVMGMFLEGVAIILIVVPVVAPVITQIGIAPEHFAVVMVINIELALLSPPIGLNLFVLSNVTGRPVSEVLRGTLPFFLLMLGLLLLITFVPEISTWLPSAVMDAN